MSEGEIAERIIVVGGVLFQSCRRLQMSDGNDAECCTIKNARMQASSVIGKAPEFMT